MANQTLIGPRQHIPKAEFLFEDLFPERRELCLEVCSQRRFMAGDLSHGSLVTL